MKKCTICKIDKPIDEFYKIKTKKGTPTTTAECKVCNRAKSLDYHFRNRENSILKLKNRYHKNKDNIRIKIKQDKLDNPDKYKRYYDNNYLRNKDSILLKNKEYYLKNKSKINKYNQDWKNDKVKNDPLYAFRRAISSRMSSFFKSNGIKKESRTLKLLGGDYLIAKLYIEKQFKKGMTWENYGEWHIDHVIPLNSAKTKEDTINLCHYTNLQPLWAKENLSKGAKMINPIQMKITI